MNKERRTRLEKLIEKLEEIKDSINDIRDEIECVKDEEQEAYDNMPESIQQSDRGCNMEENIDDLDSAYDIDIEDSVDEIIDYLQGVIDR